MKKTLIIVSLLIAIPLLVFAADPSVFKNDGMRDGFVGGDFSVDDTGNVIVKGTDERNDYQMIIAGHEGGDSHVQLVTDQANSRMTVMASRADDFAPRLHMIGPRGAGDSLGGSVILDYGSKIYYRPNAQFRVRHALSGGYADMMLIFGREAVVFPQSDVVVGIRTDNPQHPLQVTTGGAYCDGNQWVNKSSRDAKENIAELSTSEAFETLRNIKPVKFNYKKDGAKETNVGFIAEDVPELVATQGREGLVAMEVVAVLTKVVQEQQELISSQQKAFDEQKLLMAELMQRIKDMEKR